MKNMKVVLPALVLVSLILISSFSTGVDGGVTAQPPAASVCDSKCGVRCEKAGMKDRCLKYCGICCQQCKCVPSGTYGNKSECPCYRDMKNSKGKSKCP